MDTQRDTIVITSIYPPTQAVRAFASLPDYDTLVVGDRKSPPDWHHDGVDFLSVAAQEDMAFHTCKRLPYNHYSRKMAGYLQALSAGAKVVIDTDDDNIPKPGWSFPEFVGCFEATQEDLGFLNVYKLFTDQHIWPRGFPLRLVLDAKANCDGLVLREQRCNVGIWQGLADGDPDVDAIYRLTNNSPCVFSNRAPVVLRTGALCPFNSQNTAVRRELAALLYLPAYVTFRFTDILRGLIAQCILWAGGYSLGFIGATVVQERNPHDYTEDFVSELPCYLQTERVVQIALEAISATGNVSENLGKVYRALAAEQIVPNTELDLLDAWLCDVKALGVL